METWFRVCRADQLKPGEVRAISVLARKYAVFNVDGTLHGIDGACAHMKAALSSGRLEGKIVTCRMHGWRYDVTTGECLNEPDSRLATFPVKIESGSIWIAIGPSLAAEHC